MKIDLSKISAQRDNATKDAAEWICKGCFNEKV